MKIGFIGLGVMGAPMAKNLAAAGHQIITTLNRNPLPDDLDAQVLDNPAAVAAESEVIITMLPDTPDVESVLLGEAGVLAGVSSGTLMIDMSSISPIATATFAEAFKNKDVEYIDAP